MASNDTGMASNHMEGWPGTMEGWPVTMEGWPVSMEGWPVTMEGQRKAMHRYDEEIPGDNIAPISRGLHRTHRDTNIRASGEKGGVGGVIGCIRVRPKNNTMQTLLHKLALCNIGGQRCEMHCMVPVS